MDNNMYLKGFLEDDRETTVGNLFPNYNNLKNVDSECYFIDAFNILPERLFLSIHTHMHAHTQMCIFVFSRFK